MTLNSNSTENILKSIEDGEICRRDVENDSGEHHILGAYEMDEGFNYEVWLDSYCIVTQVSRYTAIELIEGLLEWYYDQEFLDAEPGNTRDGR